MKAEMSERFSVGHLGCDHRDFVINPHSWPCRVSLVAVICLIVPFPLSAFGQEAGAQPNADARPAAESAEAVSLRYRFSEKYATDEDPAKPWLVNQYQVGTVATRKLVVERQQGAPERSETTLRMRFTERAAKVNNLGEVTDAVRRYDKFDIKGLGPVAPLSTQPLFDKLLIWYRNRGPGQSPQIISLDPARSVRDDEYLQIVQSQVFFPGLKSLIPTVPTQIGDKWPLSVASAERLVGKLPDDDDGRLEATLLEVKLAPSGQMMVAVFGISGELGTEQAPRSVNARLHFDFRPERPSSALAGDPKSKVAKENSRPPSVGVIEARGWISEVRLAEAQTLEVPNARLRSIITREIVMGRRPFTPKPGVLSGIDSALTVPDPMPVADEQNSWLTYEDPAGRFFFRHPQELQQELSSPDEIHITNRHAGGRQVLIIRFEPKEEKSKTGRPSQDPDHYITGFNNAWRKDGIETLPGPSGWLPDADWSPLKRKVYRREVAMLTDQDRIYDDFYLVLFTTNKVLCVEAMTSEPDHIAFRDRVENLIRGFTLGKPPRAPAASESNPAGAPGAPREKPQARPR